MSQVTIHDPIKLLESLCGLPKETGWVEFKENRFNEDSVGQYISSLANSAMLAGKDVAYLVFGVRDETHEIVGTTVDLSGETVGNEDFLLWLNKHLEPKIIIKRENVKYNGKNVEILCISPGYLQPVKFKRQAYIRIDSNQQSLVNYPEIERSLWQITSRFSFEGSLLNFRFSPHVVRDFFDFEVMLDRIGVKAKRLSANLEYLAKRQIIRDDMQEGYEAYNIFAITCAKNLNTFPLLENKGVRLIVYKGKDKFDAVQDIEGRKGYLISFPSLLNFILSVIPSKEILSHGTRVKSYSIPEISIREFLANAVVHQDFTQIGSRPTVEVYKDRIKITNPGTPLVSVDRFIDTPSKTRNPRFAKLMNEAGFCEERGSGVDRAIREIEKEALPPPLIEEVEGATVVTLFMMKRFADMTPEERIRACFQHSCLCHERGEPMTNASLRERFGLTQKQYPQVSNVIRDAVEANRIKPLHEDQANRNARYVPFYVM